MRNVHELALADMTDAELQGFYETCEVAALAWLSPGALNADGLDAAAISDGWMQKAQHARDELDRRSLSTRGGERAPVDPIGLVEIPHEGCEPLAP